MNFLTTTLPLRAYLFTFDVFVTAAKRLSFLMNQIVITIKEENILTYLTCFDNRTESFTPISETRDCVRKSFETQVTHEDNILKKKLRRHLKLL